MCISNTGICLETSAQVSHSQEYRTYAVLDDAGRVDHYLNIRKGILRRNICRYYATIAAVCAAVAIPTYVAGQLLLLLERLWN